jgi:polysaccharide export outer membrane protein
MAVLLLLSGSPLEALAAAAAKPAAADPANEMDLESLQDRIAPGDTVSIAVFPANQYSRDVLVQPDGTIQMPLIGTVSLMGLKVEEAQSLLRRKYAPYVSNPEIAVNVQRFTRRTVIIIGFVRNPGVYDYRDGMTLMELITLASGPIPEARLSHVQVLRKKGPKNLSFIVDFTKTLQEDRSASQFLAPGDMVYVPREAITNASVWVNKNIRPYVLIGVVATTLYIALRKRKN